MNNSFKRMDLPGDAAPCARLMAESDPWKKLGREESHCFALLNDSLSEVFEVRSDGTLAGFAVLKMNGSLTGYVQTLFVFPEFQGQGVGRRFLGFLEEYIFRYHPNVFICASSFNPGAIKLYKSMAYEVVGELRDYIIPGYSEVLFRKTIAPLHHFSGRK